MNIHNMSPLKYNQDGVRSLISHEEENEVIRQEIYCKEIFMHCNELGLIEKT